MFKANNEDTSTTSMTSSVSVVNFEHVIAGWECEKPTLELSTSTNLMSQVNSN